MMAEHITPHNPLEGDKPEIAINLHDGTDEQVSIIIVHKDKPEYLNICLQSIAVTSFNNNYEIIVVDNGSGKDTQDFLEEIQDEVKVIRNSKNLYWSRAANQGVEAANKSSKYYVFLHCDVVITNPAWLDLLVNVAEAQNCGLVGTELQSYMLGTQKVSFIQEWCLLVSKEAWNDIGPFPEELPQIGPAFILTLRAQTEGHNPQIVNNPICHHYRIFSLDINEYEKLIEKAMVDIPKMINSVQSKQVVNPTL
jgi:GT2 family glycosyltransferase